MRKYMRVFAFVALKLPRTLPILMVTAGLAALMHMRVGTAADEVPVPSAAAAATSDSQALQVVTVTARRLDQSMLDHVIIPRFVQSHGAPNPLSNQVGRWTRPFVICPSTQGLQPAADEYVSRRIMTVASNVGAPTAVYAHCRPSVEIIFTSDPQARISYFGKNFRDILGYDGKSLKELLTVTHSIQAWYTTATQTSDGIWNFYTDRPLFNPADPRTPYFSNFEDPGSASRLSVGLVSGFGNVLVIADTKQVSEHSLASVADYIAMLVLTRTSVAGCSELPSIIDLLSTDCGGRAPPKFITGADIAYLKALYSADLEKNLNLERGEMHDLMLQGVLPRQTERVKHLEDRGGG